MNIRTGAKKILEHPVFNVAIVVGVLFSVFIWDILHGWFDNRFDGIVEILLALTLVLFTFELGLLVVSNKKWYRSIIFWVYFVATVTMLLDLPHVVAYLSTSNFILRPLANFRLIKIIRIMARLGRIVRIVKNSVLGRVKDLVDKLFNKTKDKASVVQMKRLKETIMASDNNDGWTGLEQAMTFGILTVFFILLVPVNIYLDRVVPATPAEQGFEMLLNSDLIAEPGVPQQYLSRFPEVIFMEADGKDLFDKRDDYKLLRVEERRTSKYSDGNLEITLLDQMRMKGKILTTLNLIMVLFSSVLTVFIEWIISHYGLEISGTLKTLAHALDERDPYTRMHSRNVSMYAVKMAQAMGMKNKDLEVIKLAGELHDIGKIGVPEAILHKPGKLDDEEYDVMKRHPTQGLRILGSLVNIDQIILATYHHHEKYNGFGYPSGLKGDEIPRISQILAVCDVWDALTTDRPYRAAMKMEDAKKIMDSEKGKGFNPELVDLFFEVEAWRKDADFEPTIV